MMSFRLILCCVLLSVGVVCKSQENTIHKYPNPDFDQAVKYFLLEEYGSAYSAFERVQMSILRFPQSEQELYRSESRFYQAIIALKMGQNHSPQNLIDMHNTAVDKNKRDQLSYYLGDHFFEKGSFKEALSWYQKSDEDWMGAKQRDRYRFRLAYSMMKSGNQAGAIEAFDRVLEDYTTQYSELSNYYNGVMLFNQKEFERSEKYLNRIQTTKNSKLDVPFILGQIHFINKKYTEVVQLNEPYVDLDNGNQKERLILLGKSYFQLARYDKSEKYIEEYLQKTEKVSAEDMYQLAFSEYQNKNYAKAITHFKDLQLSSQDFSSYAMYTLGKCYLIEGEKNNARLAFISASKYDQDSVIKRESIYNIAKLNFELNNFSEAIRGFRYFLERYPSTPYLKEINKMMTQSLLASNDYPQAIELIEKDPELIKGSEKLYQEVCYVYALNLYKNNNYVDALKYLNKSIKNPYDQSLLAEAIYLRSDIYERQREYQKSKESYTELANLLLSENIQYLSHANLMNAYYSLGYAEYREQNFRSALDYMLWADQYQPLKPNEDERNIIHDIRLRTADLFFLTRSYDSAYSIYSFISSNKLKGTDYALLQQATILGLKKRYSEKITMLRSLLNDYKKSMYADDAQFQIGLANEDLENYDEAIKEYNDIAKNKPQSSFAPKSLIRIATINLNRNKISDANKYYTMVIENYPNAPEADQALKAMRETFTAEGKLDEYFEWLKRLPNHKQLDISTKDSMLFDAGEELYANSDCAAASNYFNKYLNLFPQGIFNKKARYYLAECDFNSKKYESAIQNYLILTQKNDNPHYENAAIRLGYIYYHEQKNPELAYEYYYKVNEVASSAKNQLIARLGLMLTSYETQKYTEALQAAKSIESDADIPANYKKECQYYVAMSHYYLGDKALALDLLTEVAKDKNSAKGAEAVYYQARLMYEKGEYNKSNQVLLKAKSTFASYQFWVVKYHILLAENFHKLGDYFQAKATLESIIQNYKGDQSLILEAKDRLAEVEQTAKSKSKVSY